jgi:zinc protease
VPAVAGQLLMRGTKTMTRQQIQDELTKLKAQLMVSGGSGGAMAMIQTTRANLPAVLKLAAEILKNPAFPEKEFDELKQQQLAAYESQKSDPAALASVDLSRHLNPYPKSDPRYSPGLEEQIERTKAVTLDDVKKFYAEFYGASKGEISVVGDFDAEQTQQLVTSLFGDWKSKASYARVRRQYQKVEAVNKAIETPDKANATFYAGISLNLSDEHADYPALAFGNFLLGGGFLNSRLAVRIRQKEGLSYGVSSMLSASPKEPGGMFMMRAICAPQNVQKVEAAFKEELARALKDGFTPEELEAGKTGWLQSRRVSRAQDNMLANGLASAAYNDRTMAFDAELEKKIQLLTPAQIQQAMQRHLKVEDISIFKAGDFKKAGLSF